MNPVAIHAKWPGRYVIAGDEIRPVDPADSVPTAAEIQAAEDEWNAGAEARQALDDLARSDKEMARVGEDVLVVLEAKGVMARTDLPQAAQDVIAARQAARAKL